MNFSFDVGRRVIDQGLLPHCISTDLTLPGRARIVHSMTAIMTRFLGFGFSIADVITMSTANPARAIGADGRIGSLRAGRIADVSVLDLVEGEWEVYDSVGATMRVDRAFVPHLTLKGGRVFMPDFGPRPWGWLPDPGRPHAHAGHGCCG